MYALIVIFIVALSLMLVRNKNIKYYVVIFTFLFSAIGVFYLFLLYLMRDGSYDWIHKLLLPTIYKKMYLFPFFRISMDNLIRGMNLFSFGFIISAMQLSLLILNQKNVFTRYKKYILIAFCFEYILYEPRFQKILYYMLYPKYMSAYEYYRVFQPTVHQITVLFHFFCLSFAVINLVYACVKIRYTLVIRGRMIFFTINTVSLIVLYGVIFWGYPTFLIRISKIANMEFYESIAIKLDYKMYQYLPIALIVCIAFCMLSFLFYISFYFHISKKSRTISRKIEDSYLGTRVLAHYVKNQILDISAMVENVMEEGNIDEDSRKALSETVESCKIAYEHLNKTHGLAKIQNLNIRVASFINIVNNVLQLREKELCDCRINVINESTVGQCLMDEFYMEKVVDNLIINAYESYQRKNKKEKYINITIKDNNGFVRLEIQDGGSGIDKQELDKVFEPFYSSKKSVTNWGVGLSYSYQIIKLHNGEIVAESELEKGSTFTVVLPAYYNIL